jgi:quinol monooxygenase YgiN
MSGAVTLTGWISVPPEELARLRPLLDAHVRLTRAEPGCLAFSVMPAAGDPGRLEVTERFRDRAALEAHQARTAASPWGAATRHLVRHYRIEEEA